MKKTILSLLLALSCAAAYGQATLGTNFAGETRIQLITTTGGGTANDAGQGIWPTHMDPGIAIGNTYIVTMSRQGIFIYNKSGVLQTNNASGTPVTTWSTSTVSGLVVNGFWDPNVFWKTIGGISNSLDFISAATNPQITYDFQSHRWYVSQTMFTTSSSCNAGAAVGDLLAVSAPDDPFHWKAFVVAQQNASYPFTGAGTARCGDWQAKVGYNANIVVYCTQDNGTGSNSQQPTLATGSLCTFFPKADLAWTGGGAPLQTHQVTYDFLGEGRYFPAEDYTPTTTNALALVSRGGTNQNDPGSGLPLILNMRTVTISGTTPTVSSLSTISNSVTYFAFANFNATGPPAVSPQAGTTTWYLRNWENVKIIGTKEDSQGNVWFAVGMFNSHTTGTGHNTGFWWFKVNLSGTVLLSGSQFDSVGSTNYRYPTFALYDDQAGSVTGHLCYDEASLTEYQSLYCRVIPAHSSTMGAPLLVKAGFAAAGGDTAPTPKTVPSGTWLSLKTDPADPSKQWLYAQYGGNSPTGSTFYTAWISQIYNTVTVSSADATVPITVSVALTCTDNNGIDVSSYASFSASSGGGLGSFTANVFTAGGAAGSVTFSCLYLGASSPNKTITITSPGATLNSVTASVAAAFILDNTSTMASCTAHYSDGTNPDVSSAATYSTPGGGVKASVSGRTVSGVQGGGSEAIRCTFGGVNSGSSGGDTSVTVTSSSPPSGRFAGVLPPSYLLAAVGRTIVGYLFMAQ